MLRKGMDSFINFLIRTVVAFKLLIGPIEFKERLASVERHKGTSSGEERSSY